MQKRSSNQKIQMGTVRVQNIILVQANKLFREFLSEHEAESYENISTPKQFMDLINKNTPCDSSTDSYYQSILHIIE